MSNLIGYAEVLRRLGLSHATVWHERKNGRFPAPIRLSAKRIAWDESDIQEWIEARRGAR